MMIVYLIAMPYFCMLKTMVKCLLFSIRMEEKTVDSTLVNIIKLIDYDEKRHYQITERIMLLVWDNG